MSSYTLLMDDGTELALDGSTGLTLQNIQGHGMPPIKTVYTEYALRDGAVFQRQKAKSRTVTLMIAISDADECGLRAARLKLIEAMSPQRANLPITLRYYDGKGGRRELCCYYDSGLEASWYTPYNYEVLMLRLIATDPFWRSSISYSGNLNPQDLMASFMFMYSRPTIGGAWSSINAGADDEVYTMAVDPNTGYLYVGGAFHAVGGLAVNHIAMFDGVSWSAMGAGCSSDVYKIVVGPGSTIYAVSWNGTFAGAFPNIAVWSGGAWQAVGGAVGGTQQLRALGIDSHGYIYVGGNIVVGASQVNARMFNGATWVTLAGGITSGQVNTLVVAPGDKVYFSGTFNNVDGNVWKKIAMWDGTAWNQVGGDLDTGCWDLEAAPNGDIFLTGTFTDCAGVPCLGIAKWNGTSYSPLGTGLNGIGYTCKLAQNGDLYVGGDFTEAGGLPVAGGLAIWHNGVWVSGDSGGPVGANHIATIAFSPDESTIYIGTDFFGINYEIPGLMTITNPGTAISYPVLVVQGPGRLYYIRNSTTGKVIYFNLDILTGEMITIDLSPGVKTVTSSFRGNVISTVYAGDLLTWGLVPGANLITMYVNNVLATGVYSYIPLYWSLD